MHFDFFFNIITSPKDKAELFAKNFSSISSLDSTSCVLPDIAVKQVDPLLDIRITPASVSKVISCLDSSTACSPDNIPVVALQKCSAELSSILSKLFNKCLSESCFPACWKAASVFPIFKNSGERSGSSSYRPISLLPTISKVFESLINKHLISDAPSLNEGASELFFFFLVHYYILLIFLKF